MNMLLISGISVVASLVIGFSAGVDYHAGKDAIKEQARVVNQRSNERLQRQNSNTAAIGHEEDKIVIQKEFVEVVKEINHVVNKIEYRDRACFDNDGVHALNAAIARANGDTSQPADTVPKATKLD